MYLFQEDLKNLFLHPLGLLHISLITLVQLLNCILYFIHDKYHFYSIVKK